MNVIQESYMSRLNVLDRFPEFTVNTAFRTAVQMSELLAGKRTVLRVLRYAGCPTCRIDMRVLADAYPEFEKRNTQIIVVMQSDQAHLRTTLNEEPLPFEIISDPDEVLYRTLSIRAAENVEELRGSDMTRLLAKRKAAEDAGYVHGDYEGNELQLPAMFIIEPDGLVSCAHYAQSIADMPMAEETLRILDETEGLSRRMETGDRIPDFIVDTQNGHYDHFHEMLKGKTVLWVLRYIGCTVCRYDVHMIMKRYEEFTSRNAKVIVVMQSDTAHLLNDLKQSDTVLPFEIIADPGQVIYQRLGINAAGSKEAPLGSGMEQLKQKGAAAREAGFSHGDYEGNELQLPALFILDDQGTVLYSHYAQTLMDMPDIDQVLQLIETL